MDWQFDDNQGITGALYSRALFGDLGPEPMSPLTATAGVGAELDTVCRQLSARAGLAGEPGARVVARFGSYLYLDTSLLRRLGESVGADPIAFSWQFLSGRPDVPRRRERAVASAPLNEQVLAAALTGYQGQLVDGPPGGGRRGQEPNRDRAARADLHGRSEGELAARIRQQRAPLRRALRGYLHAELAAGLTADLLARMTEQAGHPAHPGALLAGCHGQFGDQHQRLWSLSRKIAHSTALSRLFDAGISAVTERLALDQTGELARFRACLHTLVGRYGHLGCGEWELSTPTWDTDPRLVPRLLDGLRRAEDNAEPAIRARVQAEHSRARAAEVRASVGAAERPRFDAALAASRHWVSVAELYRMQVAEVHHELRLAARELGRRQVDTGLLDDVCQIFLLHDSELDAFCTDPGPLGEPLRMRAYDYHALAKYQPPFTALGRPAPVVEWPARPVAPKSAARVELTGTPASPGTAVGPARLPRTPTDTRALRQGDVLVLASAGPAWVALLPLAGAVVVDGGGPCSAVARACRALAVPCVVGTVDASARISQGQQVTVNGCTVTG